MTTRSITKTVRIERTPAQVFGYLSNLENWPRWATLNVLSTGPRLDAGWWSLETPRGTGRIRIRGDAEHGILDHDFVDEQASWSVPARVVPNGAGAEFMMTFFQPPSFADEFFDEQVRLVDRELLQLKRLLEGTT